MSKTVNQRLRAVDKRIAKIDRRLGFLEGRVFFQSYNDTVPAEVEILEFTDNGITPKDVATGEVLSTHRYTVRVNRDWIEAHSQEEGRWWIQRHDSDPMFLCEKESESYQDKDTFATINLRVSQEITYA